MILLCHVIVVLFSGYGMAVALVEKKRQWPIRRYNLMLRKMLGKIHRKLPKMLDCTVCTSFWTALVAEFILGTGSVITKSWPMFTWPLSGFITVGFTWTIIDITRSLAWISDSLTEMSKK